MSTAGVNRLVSYAFLRDHILVHLFSVLLGLQKNHSLSYLSILRKIIDTLILLNIFFYLYLNCQINVKNYMCCN